MNGALTAWSVPRALVLFAFSLAPSATQAADAEFAYEVELIVEEERAHHGAAAISVAAVRNGEIILKYASGLADKEAERAATIHTQFPAASVSKILTAVLVMRQVEAGKLDLDEHANAYLEPAFHIRDEHGEAIPATLRQLLSHNAGLPVSWHGIVNQGKPVPTLENYLAKGQTIIRAPGKRVVYANDGFALAGYIAAQAAGLSFAEYAQEALFDPLGMTRSTFESPSNFHHSLAAAYGHWFRGGIERTTHADATPIAPAGALITTAPDLARFALMILNGGEFNGARILTPESIAEMMLLQAKTHRDMDQGFGLGFAVRERPGRRMIWWDGSLSGAAARFALLPDQGMGIVVLSNLANNEFSSVTGRRILDTLGAPSSPNFFQPSEQQMNSAVGFYRLRDHFDPRHWYLNYIVGIEIKQVGDAIFIKSPITGEQPLLPVGPNRFRVQGSSFDDSTVLFDNGAMYLGYAGRTQNFDLAIARRNRRLRGASRPHNRGRVSLAWPAPHSGR